MLHSDLKEADRKYHLAKLDDGLVDLVDGLLVVSFGLGMLTGKSLFFILSWLPSPSSGYSDAWSRTPASVT